MKQKNLFIFLEGLDDRRFFERIILPKVSKKQLNLKIIEYSMLKKEKVKNYLNTIKSMGDDYFWIVDINDSPCVQHKKSKILEVHKNLDYEKIIVVVKEIESWYIAGISENLRKRLKLKPILSTDSLNKEIFNKLASQSKQTRLDFILEILENYSLTLAIKRNKSLNYLISKF